LIGIQGRIKMNIKMMMIRKRGLEPMKYHTQCW